MVNIKNRELSNWNLLHIFLLLCAVHAHIIVSYWSLTTTFAMQCFGGSRRLFAKSCSFGIFKSCTFCWCVNYLKQNKEAIPFLSFLFVFWQKTIYFPICYDVKSWPTKHKTMDQFVMAQCVKCIGRISRAHLICANFLFYCRELFFHRRVISIVSSIQLISQSYDCLSTFGSYSKCRVHERSKPTNSLTRMQWDMASVSPCLGVGITKRSTELKPECNFHLIESCIELCNVHACQPIVSVEKFALKTLYHNGIHPLKSLQPSPIHICTVCIVIFASLCRNRQSALLSGQYFATSSFLLCFCLCVCSCRSLLKSTSHNLVDLFFV